MTTTTDELAATIGGRTAGPLRVVAAFIGGLVAAALLVAALAYAYETAHAGRIYPGVRIGDLDVSGLSAAEAAGRLRALHGSLGDGTLVVEAPDGIASLTYAELGRRIDAEGLAADAYELGRTGDPVARLVEQARLLARGGSVPLRVAVDEAELSARIGELAGRGTRAPIDASVISTPVAFVATGGVDGRGIDPAPATAKALALLGDLGAPGQVRVILDGRPVEPTVTDDEAAAAAAAAERMAQDVVFSLDGERWRVGARTVRRWIGFAVTPGGGYEPVVDRAAVELNLRTIARRLDREPVDAEFLIGKGNVVVGVEPSVDGRALDLTTSSGVVAAALGARTRPGAGTPEIVPVVVAVRPRLATAEATRIAPEMALISTWTTYYPIGIKNGYGANIEIPTRLIDGTIVPAGGTFDFWDVVGEVSEETGYKPGGAIIDGRTEPTGALAGGICSCSTTLFNAALRAGFEVGPRMNHYYYIDRYPLGLDATVWISSGGGRQSMSWRNDTEHPVLIRGSIRHVGTKGYVTFDLWSVPSGRTVELTEPIVKNEKPATTITEETPTLLVGTKEQIEWAADGKDVWVSRTVRDRDGTVIRTETFYSHYARVDGIILVGTATSLPPDGSPAPTPAPTPVP